jgi:hypothetical protein
MVRGQFWGGQYRPTRAPREPYRMPPSRKDERLTRRMSHQSMNASSFVVTRVGSEGGEVILVGTVISDMQGAGAVWSAPAS